MPTNADEASYFGDTGFSSKPHYYNRYFIDGFRSLQNFSIKLEEGLNVFVGANGAGKTSFIALLDFLSTFLNNGLAAAVSDSGGIARVFSQESLKNRIPRVQIQVSGLADLLGHIGPDNGRRLFRYEYELDIRYSRSYSSVYVASEKIKFKSLFWDDLAVYVDSTVGTLSIRRRSPLEDVEPEFEIGARLHTRGEKNPLRYASRLRTLRSAKPREGPRQIEIQDLGPDQSILSARGYLPAFDAVRTSLARGKSFNLDPAAARSPSEITTIPIIASDGSGLSATLYHLEQAKKGHSTVRNVFRRFSGDDLDTIIEWTKLVLPDLDNITTVADPHTGKYLSSLHVGFDDDVLKVPLQAVSDGTIKWLSFVCLIIAGGTARSIEEPENFLHPRMQRMLIALIRENMDVDHPGHVILSTHSESIINQCKPEELVLFEFRKGKTRASRLSHPDKVAEQINKTGFGLGYYYAANAVS